MVEGFVVKVGPMEVVVGVKFAVVARVGEVEGFVGFHGDKDLHEGKEAAKDAFTGVGFDLVDGLFNGYSTAFEFDVNDGHSVNEEEDVTPTVME